MTFRPPIAIGFLLAISCIMSRVNAAPTTARADITAISGSGNIQAGSSERTADESHFSALARAGGHAIRLNVYPFDYYSDNGPTPAKIDDLMLSAHEHGVRTIIILFEYYGTMAKEPGIPMRLGDAKKWQSIGHVFAERFAPNSSFLIAHGVRDWGITIYSAFNEPDIGPPVLSIPGYFAAMEGLADGVHAIDSKLAVIPGGLGSMNERSSATLGGYGSALAPLFNNGKLDGIDLHTYNDIKWAPLIDKDGHVQPTHCIQSNFEQVKKACGITRDINFYCTEYNFKSNEQGIDELLAAKRFLTCMWMTLGVVKWDGHTPATKLALVWNLFNLSSSDKTYGLTESADPQTFTARGKTFEMVMQLTAGMAFQSLDPHDRGEFVLTGNHQMLWIWQNYEQLSSIYGDHYTINQLPEGATTLKVYGWDGLRTTIDVKGQRSCTVANLREQETYMFLIND